MKRKLVIFIFVIMLLTGTVITNTYVDAYNEEDEIIYEEEVDTINENVETKYEEEGMDIPITEEEYLKEMEKFAFGQEENGYEDWYVGDEPGAFRAISTGYTRSGTFYLVRKSDQRVFTATSIKVISSNGSAVSTYYVAELGGYVTPGSTYYCREYITVNETFKLTRTAETYTHPFFANKAYVTSATLAPGEYTVSRISAEFIEIVKADGSKTWISPQYYPGEKFISTSAGTFTSTKQTVSVNSVNSVPIHQKMMPVREDKRTGIAMKPQYVTIHNTANTGNGADALAHANAQLNDSRSWVSWHYTVDNKSIYQSMPMNEMAWHAGDGLNLGNATTIGIEICENNNGNYAQAERNAAYLTARLLYENGLPSDAVKMHRDWSGKICPRNVIEGTKGTMGWDAFKALVKTEYNRLVTTLGENGSLTGVVYQTHTQTLGWLGNVSNGNTSGTTGQSKRVEALKITLKDMEYTGGITYRSHVQNEGWQDWKSDGALSGTTGQYKRVEALEIKLTGEIAEHYDVYYRTHVQTFGWMGWAKNGESAGTAGYEKRVEAIQIKLVAKGGSAPGSTSSTFKQNQLKYQAHVQTIGWQSAVSNGEIAGTTGRYLRLEGINISLRAPLYNGAITYRTHVQNIGWQDWKSNGETAGTTGKYLRLEAIQIKLTGEMEKQYDIYYRAHVQGYGWLDWAKNGQTAGTSGKSLRMESIQICLVEKGSAAPGATANPSK